MYWRHAQLCDVFSVGLFLAHNPSFPHGIPMLFLSSSHAVCSPPPTILPRSPVERVADPGKVVYGVAVDSRYLSGRYPLDGAVAGSSSVVNR